MRTFIHVADIARPFLLALEHAEQMTGEGYNVGEEAQNLTKRDICEKRLKEVKDTYIHFADFAKDADQQNYEVSYKKIKSLGYRTNITVDEGISELVRALECIQIHTPYANV